MSLPISISRTLIAQALFELSASHKYLLSSLFLSHHHYPGSASFFQLESNNERQHGTEIFNYLVKRGHLPTFAGSSELLKIPTGFDLNKDALKLSTTPTSTPASTPNLTTDTEGLALEGVKLEKIPDVFTLFYDMEKENLRRLEEASRLAHGEKDVLTIEFLGKFLKEQLDSVNEAEELLQKAKFYCSIPGLFYHLDHELGKKGK